MNKCNEWGCPYNKNGKCSNAEEQDKCLDRELELINTFKKAGSQK